MHSVFALLLLSAPTSSFVRGQLVRDGVPATAMVSLHRLPADVHTDGERLAQVKTDEEGRFQLPAAPGRYELSLFEVLKQGQRDRRLVVNVPRRGVELQLELTNPSRLEVSHREPEESHLFLFPGHLRRAMVHDGGAIVRRAYMLRAGDGATFLDLEAGDYTLQSNFDLRHVVIPEKGVVRVSLADDWPPGKSRPADAFEPARPSDYSPQADLHVLQVDAAVEPVPSEDDCRYGQQFVFEGAITVDGPGVVTFTWERSDGAYDAAGPRRMVFERAGTQKVSTTWKLGPFEETFWKRLHVFTPHELLSAPAHFVADCR